MPRSLLGRPPHPERIDADGGEPVLDRLVAQPVDLLAGGAGGEQGVVDVAAELARHPGAVAVVADPVGALAHHRPHLVAALGGAAALAVGATILAPAQLGQDLAGDRFDQVVRGRHDQPSCSIIATRRA